MSERLPDLKTASRERIGWIDLLRVLACFLVVFSHCCDPFVAVFDSDRPTFLYGCFSGSLVRCCVPLFVMMTGVLLLPVRTDTAVFYRKRIGRILLALIFWSVALPLLYLLYTRIAPETSLDAGNYTWEATLPKLWNFIFNFTYETTPLWYLYMLAGLYLVMPVLSAWLERIAGATFGIYLCHFVFVQAGYDLIGRIPGLPVPVRIVLNACAAFAVSYGAVWLMQRSRITRRLVE